MYLLKERIEEPRTYMRWFHIVLPIVVLQAIVGCHPSGARLNGGGSSFIFPMMIRWARDYHEKTGVQVDYSSAGSGNGQRQMIARIIQFGCTDAFINDKLLKEAAARPDGGPILHIPLLLGAVVPVYNLPNVDQPLRFTGPLLADIFLGKVTHWNDARLREANPGVMLPDLPILVVSRADSSGTTAIWVDYLGKVHPEIVKAVGQGTNATFSTGIRERGNERVAGKVLDRPGAIGYVELVYALQSKLSFGAVQNAAGRFVRANLASVTAAAEASLTSIPEDLRFSLTNAPGEESYPICGAVWAVCYERQNAADAKLLGDFLSWAVHEGQETTAALNYARLPAGLVARIDKKLERLAPREKRP